MDHATSLRWPRPRCRALRPGDGPPVHASVQKVAVSGQEDCAFGCVCGDFVCDPACGENVDTCPQDRGFGCVCGDFLCDQLCGEDLFSCPLDCSQMCACSNFNCEPFCGEDQLSCPSDC